MVTGKQIAAARALLGMSAADLADRAGRSLVAIEDLEAGSVDLPEDDVEMAAVTAALERAGVTFIAERTTSAAGGVGIRLTVPTSSSLESDPRETVQYPEMAKNGPFGAGG